MSIMKPVFNFLAESKFCNNIFDVLEKLINAKAYKEIEEYDEQWASVQSDSADTNEQKLGI